MPLTAAAAGNSLQWVRTVASVGLLHNVGQFGGITEISGGSYVRQPITFTSPGASGFVLSSNLVTFQVDAGWTVCWYALYSTVGTLLAIMPHAVGVDNNPPLICMFQDTVTGWIDAPDHTLTVGQEIIFQSGPSLYSNTYPSTIVDPINGGLTNLGFQNTMPYDVVRAYGTFFIWHVAQVDTHKFRISVNEGQAAYVPFYTGWGYYQRITRSSFQTAGTMTISSIRISEFG